MPAPHYPIGGDGHSKRGAKIRSKKYFMPAALVGVLATSTVGLASTAQASMHHRQQPNASQSVVRFAAVLPFSGTLAAFAPSDFQATQLPCTAINNAGGIMGHRCVVDPVNDYSDAADAVPSMRKELAAKGLIAAYGVLSDVAPALMPMLSSSHIPAFSVAGEAQYIKYNPSKYLYMLQPPDEANGLAMAVAAKKYGFKHPAVLTVTTTDAVPTRQGIIAGLKLLGIKPAIDLVIAPTQTAYGTEAARLYNAHPDGIIFELDSATAATFLGNLATIEGGSLTTKLVTDNSAAYVSYFNDVSGAIGKQTLMKLTKIVVASVNNNSSNASYKYLQSHYNPKTGKAPFSPGFLAPFFDAVTLTALAADEAHSLNPSSFAPYIYSINNGTPGAVTVNTYAAGLKEIKKGKKVHFVGATGGFQWSSYHARFANFSVETFNDKGSPVTSGQLISASSITSLLSKH